MKYRRYDMADPVAVYSDILKAHDLKVSHQRIRLLEYLAENFIHPTADRIMTDLKDELPTLSKSTVYKTLNALFQVPVI